jgi:outer membrane protein TolC
MLESFPSIVAATVVRLVLLAVLGAAAGCAVSTPHIDHGPGAPAGPGELWPVPPPVRVPPPSPVPATAPAAEEAFAADSADAAATRELSLPDVLDLALRNNPATQASWATARAQADLYGANRGALWPTINANIGLTHTGGSISGIGGVGGVGGVGGIGGGTGVPSDSLGGGTGGVGRSGGLGARTVLSPSLTLSYLIFDFGGRAGAIEAARQRAIALDLAHNATVRDVVLEVESALFAFLADRSLVEAQRTSVAEAEADLAQASERHRVGLAGIDEVLQARTALGQERLQLATLESATATAHGTLAVTMGLPANARFTVPTVTASAEVPELAASLDTLINRAIVLRPELAEAQAVARELAAEVRVARAAGYPALALSSTAGYTRTLEGVRVNGTSYSIGLGVSIPIFAGFSHRYDVRAAREQYDAALAQLASARQQITVQVLTAYYALQAAAERVRIAAGLLRDAERSAEVSAGRYRAGVGTFIELLLARSALASARAEAIQARWEWRIALVQLGHDVGALDVTGRPNVLPAGAAAEVPR